MHHEFKDQAANAYRLEEQVGFLLRRASQRHLAIFAQMMPEITSTQFAALAKLCELGPTSQNALGRATGMDAATIKGVADRLRARDLITATPDPQDRRRHYLIPTEAGLALYARRAETGVAISDETLAPLSAREQATFLELLRKLC
ncbi:MarR family transcriptional regulator [Pseudooceanicola sp. CBS1P-1]|uniref:MarR family transcriptional regulator n=1 Tax=Pseudooceanicola albus TaxID=2692189 RepID=A0A6L7G5I3_9RHOB|nr:MULTISPECIES: MarR family transcriptional regulator [Pseudooceanicola]MBT9383103.1 MarR family transcriptional regulator [Pseudooceanicola endophyticus]MXN19291.1 MarR family transcriptional regulator [Pseudooceanicola albus]